MLKEDGSRVEMGMPRALLHTMETARIKAIPTGARTSSSRGGIKEVKEVAYGHKFQIKIKVGIKDHRVIGKVLQEMAGQTDQPVAHRVIGKALQEMAGQTDQPADLQAPLQEMAGDRYQGFLTK